MANEWANLAPIASDAGIGRPREEFLGSYRNNGSGGGAYGGTGAAKDETTIA